MAKEQLRVVDPDSGETQTYELDLDVKPRAQWLKEFADAGYTVPGVVDTLTNLEDNASALEAEDIEQAAIGRAFSNIRDDAVNWVRRLNPFASDDPWVFERQLAEQAGPRILEEEDIMRRSETLDRLGQRNWPGVAGAVPETVIGAGLGALVGRNPSALGRIGGEFAVSGLMGAFSASEEDAGSILLEAGKQGATGAVIAGVTGELGPLAWKWLLPELKAAANQAAGRPIDATVDPWRLTEDSRIAGLDILPAGEAITNPAAAKHFTAMPRSVGGPLEQFILDRSEQWRSRFDSLVQASLLGGRFNMRDPSTMDTAVTAVTKGFETAVEGLQQNARNAFNYYFEPAVKQLGGRVDPTTGIALDGRPGPGTSLPLGRLKHLLEIQIQSAEQAGKDAGALRELHGKFEARNWELGPAGVQQWLRDFGTAAYGGGQLASPIQRVQDAGLSFDTRAAYAAIIDDMKAAAALSPVAGWGKAADNLLRARDAFERAIEPVNAMRQGVIDALFTNAGAKAPDQFVNEYMGLSPDSRVRVLKLLDTAAPQAADQLRGVVFGSFLARNADKMQLPGSGRGFSLRRFAESLGDLSDTEIALMVPSTATAADRRRFMASLRLLGKVKDSPFLDLQMEGQSGAGLAGTRRAGDLMINAMLRNPGFTARMAVGEFFPQTLEWMLTTKDGFKRVLGLYDGKPTRYAAVTALTAGAMANYEDYKLAEQRALGRKALEESAQQQRMIQSQMGGALPQ